MTAAYSELKQYTHAFLLENHKIKISGDLQEYRNYNDLTVNVVFLHCLNRIFIATNKGGIQG